MQRPTKKKTPTRYNLWQSNEKMPCTQSTSVTSKSWRGKRERENDRAERWKHKKTVKRKRCIGAHWARVRDFRTVSARGDKYDIRHMHISKNTHSHLHFTFLKHKHILSAIAMRPKYVWCKQVQNVFHTIQECILFRFTFCHLILPLIVVHKSANWFFELASLLYSQLLVAMCIATSQHAELQILNHRMNIVVVVVFIVVACCRTFTGVGHAFGFTWQCLH